MPERGEVWQVDFGITQKVRPALIISIPYGDADRALAGNQGSLRVPGSTKAMERDHYIVKGRWKKYITVLALSLICLDSVAKDTPQYFQSVDDLIAATKEENPTLVLRDTSGIIEGVTLLPQFSTDRNVRLLGEIKSLRYLRICNGGSISTNSIPTLAEYPNLTGLCLVCCGGPTLDLGPLLPRLTNLQTLELGWTTYRPNDTIYLATITNLTTLVIDGYIPQPQVELLPLTNLVNLRTLAIHVSDEYMKRGDTNLFSKLDKLTTVVITSRRGLIPHDVWKTPAVKSTPSNTNDLHRPLKK